MKKIFLVVGLGNPEAKYFQTWHNAGFLCADLLAEQMGIIFKKKGNQFLTDFNVGNNKIYLLKPLTYMNLSGQAVVAVARKYKIFPENIIVFVDDLYIDKGKIRITSGGSSAGHNGIKSINELLGTNQYIKIRIGIKPNKPPYNISDYVLQKIDFESRTLLDSACEKAAEAVTKLVAGETLPKLQSLYNTTNAADTD